MLRILTFQSGANSLEIMLKNLIPHRQGTYNKFEKPLRGVFIILIAT